MSLKEARSATFKNRALARQGGDPLALRKQRDAPDFAAAAATVIDIQEGAWKDGSASRHQWESSLAAYAFPVIGDKRVNLITDVLDVVLPIWATKRVTAARVRQRISVVMKWAIAQGHRADDPAGEAVLAALPKGVGKAKRHHRALPYAEVGHAVRRVRASNGWPGTKLAFEFLVLTACRSGEARLGTRDEVNIDTATWTIPAERMKGKQEHRVPLTARCIAILAEARELDKVIAPAKSEFLFPGTRGGALGSAMASSCRQASGLCASTPQA